MSVERNLTIGSIHSFFSMFLIVVPVLVPYWSSLGLSMKEILEIQAIFGVSVAVFEYPTGYIADLWSRKSSIIIGTFISACGFTLLPFAETYEALALYEIILALGSSLISGADIALIYDSISKDPNRLKHLGRLSQWSLIGEAVAALAASLLVMFSFQHVLWAQAIVMWVPFILSLFYIEPPTERMPKQAHLRNFTMVVKHILMGESITRLIFINATLWGLSSFCVVWLLQPYWQAEGVPVTYFGLLWAALMFFAAFASRSAHRVEKLWSAEGVLISLSLAACLGYLLMALTGGWVGVAVALLFYLTRGFTRVIFDDAFNWKVPSQFRATANSLRSLAFRLSYGVIGPVTGWCIDRFGLRATLAGMGCVTALCFIVFMIPLCRRIHELHVEYIPADS